MQESKLIQKFHTDVIRLHQFVTHESIIPDGKFHKITWLYRSTEIPGWYIAHLSGGLLTVFYGDWAGEFKRQWVNKAKLHLNVEDKAVYEDSMLAARKLHEETIKVAHRVAAVEALSVWEAAGPASATHPYLVKKQISCEGLRCRNWNGYDEILVALRTIDGNIVNLQRILPGSQKFYWTGAQASEVFWTAQDFPPDGFEGDIVVAEGMATAATVHAISGLPCFAAMNCGNLPKVAALFRQKWPKARLVIAADDDRWNKDGTPREDCNNPGLAKGKAAAYGIRDVVVAPPRTDDTDRGTDWNDRYCKIGEACTKEEWDNSLKVAELEKKVANCSEVEYGRDREKFLDAFKAVGRTNIRESDLNQLRHSERLAKKANMFSDNDEKQSEVLAEICKEAEFWRGLDGTAYATVLQGSCAVNARIEGTPFKDWILNRFRELSKKGGPPGRELLRGFIDSAAAQARGCSPQFAAHYRMGYDESTQCHWLDLGRSDGKMVRWDASGWTIEAGSTIKFVRSNGKIDLPLPELNPQFNKLAPFWEILNAGEEDRPLISGFLLNTLFSTSAPFALCLLGGRGSAKSMGSALIRRIIDPHPAISQTLNTRNAIDLGTTCKEQWLPIFENVSSLTADVQDMLCRLTTGLSENRRKLFTDGDQVSFNVRRPWILNGINNPVSRGDLGERTIPLTLLAAPKGAARKTEEYINRKFLECLPHVLATLLDAAVASVKNRKTAEDYLGQNNLDHRMADSLLTITGGEESVGFPIGSFIRRLKTVQQEAGADNLEGNPVLAAILSLASESPTGSWRGVYPDILAEMLRLDPDAYRQKGIPKRAVSLASWIDREKERLQESFGIMIERLGRELINGQKPMVIEIRRTGL